MDKKISPSDKKKNRSGKQGSGKKNDDNFQWKKASRSLIIWILVILASVLFAYAFRNFSDKGEQTITYSQYRNFLESKKILSAIVEDTEFHGTLLNEETIQINNKMVTLDKFRVILPFVEES